MSAGVNKCISNAFTTHLKSRLRMISAFYEWCPCLPKMIVLHATTGKKKINLPTLKTPSPIPCTISLSICRYNTCALLLPSNFFSQRVLLISFPPVSSCGFFPCSSLWHQVSSGEKKDPPGVLSSVVFVVDAVILLVPTTARDRLPHRFRRGIVAEVLVGGLLGGGLLRDVLARVDPVRVDVDGGREVVDARLEPLAAHLAVQVPDAGLLVELDLDRLFVVAEQAGEGRCKGFSLVGIPVVSQSKHFLGACSPNCPEAQILCGINARNLITFFGPAGLLDFPFRLPCRILDQNWWHATFYQMRLTMVGLRGLGEVVGNW